MAHFMATTSNITAEEMANLYLKNVFKSHGLPDDIVSEKTSPIPTKGPVEGTHHPPPNTLATYCLPEAGAASLGTPTHTRPRKAQHTAPPEALTHKGEKSSPAPLGTNHHPTALLS